MRASRSKHAAPNGSPAPPRSVWQSTASPRHSVDVALALMGGTWKPKLLYHLQHGLRRVGDFKQLVEGISENVLIQQLRELQTVDGVVRHG